MIDTALIQINAVKSAHIAAATAEYESRFGKVETVEIRKNWAMEKFFVSCPEKPKADQRPRVAKGPRKPRPDMIAQAAKVLLIPAMISRGMTTKGIAAKLEWSVVHTQKVMAANGLKAEIRRELQGDNPQAMAIIKKMAANGATVAAMSKAAGKNRKTVIIWLEKYDIVRGPKMDITK